MTATHRSNDQPFKVLVVDDSATSRLKLATAVKKLGHEVEVADGGGAGIERLEQGDIDLLLLDILMPEIDGYDVLRAIAADPRLSEIPVLVISSVEDMSEIVAAIELGATDFLPKDVDPSLLNARVSACLEKKRLRDQELAYLADVDRLTAAARIVREYDFNPARLEVDSVAQRKDALGDLASVFVHMAGEVHRREMAFRRQIDLLRGGFLLILLGVSWGLIPPLSKMLVGSTDSSNPLGLAAWVALTNLVIAAVVLGVARSVPKITWPKIRFALVVGLFGGALPQILLFLAAEHVPAVVVSITLAMESLMVFVIATLFGMESPGFRRFLGLCVGLFGVAAIIVPSSTIEGLSAPFWIFVALLVPLCYALESILILVMPSEETSAFELVFLAMLGSSFWAWTGAVGTGSVLTPSAVDQSTGLLIGGIALISSFGSWILIVAIRKTGAVFASQAAYVMTIMGVLWSMLLLSEMPTVWIWLALACMLTGMFLVQPKESAFATEDFSRDEAPQPKV